MGRYLLVLAWVVFLGFVGPWLLSAPSDFAALGCITLGITLLVLTINRITKSITKETTE